MEIRLAINIAFISTIVDFSYDFLQGYHTGRATYQYHIYLHQKRSAALSGHCGRCVYSLRCM